MEESLDSLLSQLEKIQGWPAVLLVFASCLAVGYAWRFLHFKWFADDATPVIVILWGAFAQSVLADARASNTSLRLWLWRNIIVGLVIGFAAWLTHNLILKRIEDFLALKFGGPTGDAPTITDRTYPPDPKP